MFRPACRQARDSQASGCMEFGEETVRRIDSIVEPKSDQRFCCFLRAIEPTIGSHHEPITRSRDGDQGGHELTGTRVPDADVPVKGRSDQAPGIGTVDERRSSMEPGTTRRETGSQPDMNQPQQPGLPHFSARDTDNTTTAERRVGGLDSHV